MSDKIKNYHIFKELGFNDTNLWILYDTSFQQFIKDFSENITEDNLLTDIELNERDQLQKDGSFLEGKDLENELQKLNALYPGILTIREEDSERLKLEIEQLNEAAAEYDSMIEEMRDCEEEMVREVSIIREENLFLDQQQEKTLQNVTEKAIKYQDLQQENTKLRSEFEECFSKNTTPPLFMYLMPLDEMTRKYDFLDENVTEFVRKNFNIQNFLENFSSIEIEEFTDDTFETQNELISAHIHHSESRKKLMGYKRLINEMDIERFEYSRLSEFKKQMREMEIFNEKSLSRIEGLQHELRYNIQKAVEQEIEKLLYENNKMKFERAKGRLDMIKSISKVISECLADTELFWIIMQMDLEKAKYYTEGFWLRKNDNACIQKRTDAISQLCNESSEQLVDHLQQKCIDQFPTIFDQTEKKFNTLKSFLFEHEKFCRSQKQILVNVITQQYCQSFFDLERKLDSIEKLAITYVFDGPTVRPSNSNVKFLQSIFKANESKSEIEKSIKILKDEYVTNFLLKMKNDNLFRCKQLLWIWYLTEPKRILSALEEVKKSAAIIPEIELKSLAGFKRK